MSDGLNKVMVIGNVGREPGMRFTGNGNAVVTFSVASSRRVNGKDETEWFSVVAWNKLAEVLGEHLGKGRKVYVEGRLQTRSWDDKDGAKHYKTEVVASQVIFLDRAQTGDPVFAREGDIDPEDLPFE